MCLKGGHTETWERLGLQANTGFLERKQKKITAGGRSRREAGAKHWGRGKGSLRTDVSRQPAKANRDNSVEGAKAPFFYKIPHTNQTMPNRAQTE